MPDDVADDDAADEAADAAADGAELCGELSTADRNAALAIVDTGGVHEESVDVVA